jgi:hypothetical protein
MSPTCAWWLRPVNAMLLPVEQVRRRSASAAFAEIERAAARRAGSLATRDPQFHAGMRVLHDAFHAATEVTPIGPARHARGTHPAPEQPACILDLLDRPPARSWSVSHWLTPSRTATPRSHEHTVRRGQDDQHGDVSRRARLRAWLATIDATTMLPRPSDCDPWGLQHVAVFSR